MLLIVCRICYVTKHARCPAINQVPQGDSAVYKGVEYQTGRAFLWEYNSFFREYKTLQGCAESDVKDGERKLLVVEYTITVREEPYTLETYIPIQFFHTFNGTDMTMFEAVNPSLVDGDFHSGDTLYIPYEIYKENLTESQWEQVEKGDVTYRAVLGSYPEKNELLITDICVKEGADGTDTED